MKIPSLIAHRGWASRYPENSAIGIEAALRSGVPYVEFDLQLSADAVPVVIHDPDLRRTAGVEACLQDMSLAALRTVSIHEPQRFGKRFNPTPLSTLAEIAELLQDWPQAGAFVEIKRESAEAHGVDDTVERVMQALTSVHEQCVIISFVERAVMAARRRGAAATGWVLNYYDDDSRRLADAIAPDYLICDHRKLPPEPASPWIGPWRWGSYEVTEVEQALALAARGVEVVESMAAGELIKDPRLAVADDRT